MGLQKGIHLHIHMPKETGLPVVSTPEKEKPKPESPHDELVVRLSNRDALDDKELANLQTDVVKYVRSRLEAKDMSGMKTFLKEAKDLLTPELRDLISQEIKLTKK